MKPQRQPRQMPHLSLGIATTEKHSARSNSQPSHKQTKRSEVDSGNTSTRIQLPKLSFNDLIQAQKYDSFHKLQNKEPVQASNKLILVEEPPVRG